MLHDTNSIFQLWIRWATMLLLFPIMCERVQWNMYAHGNTRLITCVLSHTSPNVLLTFSNHQIVTVPYTILDLRFYFHNKFCSGDCCVNILQKQMLSIWYMLWMRIYWKNYTNRNGWNRSNGNRNSRQNKWMTVGEPSNIKPPTDTMECFRNRLPFYFEEAIKRKRMENDIHRRICTQVVKRIQTRRAHAHTLYHAQKTRSYCHLFQWPGCVSYTIHSILRFPHFFVGCECCKRIQIIATRVL